MVKYLTNKNSWYIITTYHLKGERKMFCKRCGKYNPDSRTKCDYCGGELYQQNTQSQYNPNQYNQNQYSTSKTGVGVLLCLFLGIIGLVIGLLLYPTGSYERNTFVSGWVKCFLITIVISIILVVFTVCATLGAMY